METKNKNQQVTLIKNLKRELREEKLRAIQAMACLTEHDLILHYYENYTGLSDNIVYWRERNEIALNQFAERLRQNTQTR